MSVKVHLYLVYYFLEVLLEVLEQEILVDKETLEIQEMLDLLELGVMQETLEIQDSMVLEVTLETQEIQEIMDQGELVEMAVLEDLVVTAALVVLVDSLLWVDLEVVEEEIQVIKEQAVLSMVLLDLHLDLVQFLPQAVQVDPLEDLLVAQVVEDLLMVAVAVAVAAVVE
jgi:hypothetical protein